MKACTSKDIPQLCLEENVVSVAPFTEKEVYDVILQMKNNKAPGPDGFHAEFIEDVGVG